MYTVTKKGYGEYEVKKSKFISYVVPYKNFEKKLEQLKGTPQGKAYCLGLQTSARRSTDR